MGQFWPSLLCLLLASGLLWAEVRKDRRLQWLFKPAAAILFVLQAVLLGATNSFYGSAILAGLMFCLAGDVLLIHRESDALFKAGIAAFLLGHVAYILAFAGFDLPDQVERGVGYWFGAALIAALIVVRWLRAHLDLRELILVGIYAIVIGVMVVMGARAVIAGAPWFILPAALMFAVSDMAVARDRFVRQSPLNPFVITPLYFGAQVLFAISVGS